MPTKSFCIEAVAKAAGIEKDEATRIVNDLADYKKSKEADGTALSVDELAEEAARIGNEAQLRATLERKNTALAVMRRVELQSRLTNMISDGMSPQKALLAILEGSSKRNVRGGSLSAFSTYEAVQGKFISSIERDINVMPHIWDRVRAEADFNDKVVAEMWEARTDGKGNPGVTGDADAQYLAKVLADHSEKMRQRLNSNGSFIRKLQGWSPQSHNHGKMIKAGKKAWTKDIVPLLDFEAMGVSERDIADYLDAVYDNITLGKDSPTVERVIPSNVARKYGKSRVLHFKDAASQLAYQKVYSNTDNVLVSIAAHVDRASRDLGMLETFGPNPEATLVSIADDLNKGVTKDDKINIDDVKRRRSALGQAFAEVNGETMTAANINVANLGRNWRAVQSLSKLGGAALSALADASLFALERRTLADKTYLGAMFDTFKDLSTKMNESERIAASRIAVVIDAQIADNIQRFNAQDSAQGVVGSSMAKMFKWTGLTGWTNARKNGFAVLLSKDLADSVGKSWDELSPGFREMFTQNANLGKAEWDVIRSQGAEIIHGDKFFTPDMIDNIPDAEIAKLVSGINENNYTAKVNRKRVDLETKLRSMFIESTRNAVIEPDAKTRRWMVHGTKPGTFTGEVWRTVMQFKSFPLAYMQRILGGKRFNKAGKNFDPVGISMLISNSIAMGYLSMTMKDLAKGKTPRDPRKKETLTAALLQSGGLGIFGDFLIGEANRFGGSFAATAGGPTLGTIENLVNISRKVTSGDPDIGSEALSLTQSNLPFANMWFTKAALDYLVWFHLREMVSPGSVRRMERRMKKDFNQTYIVPPSKVVR